MLQQNYLGDKLILLKIYKICDQNQKVVERQKIGNSRLEKLYILSEQAQKVCCWCISSSFQ